MKAKNQQYEHFISDKELIEVATDVEVELLSKWPQMPLIKKVLMCRVAAQLGGYVETLGVVLVPKLETL